MLTSCTPLIQQEQILFHYFSYLFLFDLLNGKNSLDSHIIQILNLFTKMLDAKVRGEQLLLQRAMGYQPSEMSFQKNPDYQAPAAVIVNCIKGIQSTENIFKSEIPGILKVCTHRVNPFILGRPDGENSVFNPDFPRHQVSQKSVLYILSRSVYTNLLEFSLEFSSS